MSHIDHQITDVCDAYLEDTLGFDFQDMDSDSEKRVNDVDLMPTDPVKEKKLKRMMMSTGLFLRKTKLEGYNRVSMPYSEE